ncbi:S49 family peptidase [Klebsiella pneumoniae]|nr:S49 family peptidase [Klebsiella pneumoniae]
MAQIPNLHRFLKKQDIDIELHTAGQYKRTLTMLGENTEEGRRKFREDLNETHHLFKDFVHRMRPGT